MNNSQIKSIIKIVLSILFIGCLGNWSYGYYELVRFLGMVGFIVLALLDKDNQPLLVLWISSAILINPIFKIALGRNLWNIVDIVWAILLIGTLLSERKTE